MNGKQILLKTIRKKGILSLFPILLIDGMIIAAFVCFEIPISEQLGLVIIVSLISLPLIVKNIMNIAVPEKSRLMKKRPELLNIAEEHFKNIIINNKNLKVMVSNRYISFKNDPDIQPLDELYIVYKHEDMLEFIRYNKSLKFDFARKDKEISANFVSDKKILAFLEELSNYANNMRIGYNDENIDYYNEMRKKWLEDNNISQKKGLFRR